MPERAQYSMLVQERLQSVQQGVASKFEDINLGVHQLVMRKRRMWMQMI